MATLLSVKAAAGVQPKAIHAGVNAVSAIYSLAASLSVGDAIQMVKIPAGAVVTDVVFNFQTAGSITASLGDSSSTARYGVSISIGPVGGQSGIFRPAIGLPYSYSANDVVTIYPTTVTTGTISGWVGVTVYYMMDNGPSLGG